MNLSPILIQTCEARARGETPRPLRPSDGESPYLFRLQDPFGIRKAVIPLFWQEPDGHLRGLGSAFAVDPWGRFGTAAHVLAEANERGKVVRDGSGWRVIMPNGERFVLLLGCGMAFGTVALPPFALAPVTGAWSPGLQGNDPLKALTGEMNVRPIDFSLIDAQVAAEAGVENLLMLSRPRGPRVGDTVVAIGFPEIDTFRGDATQALTTISEGMFTAYGRVTALHPSGRDESTPTPVFEVACNWPPGMSGGPVFNTCGEVIGIVSRSLPPEVGSDVGVGWATWLETLNELPRWAPTLNCTNHDMRQGWGVIRGRPWSLASVHGTEADAHAAYAALLDKGYVVRQGAWRIGTDDFLSSGP